MKKFSSLLLTVLIFMMSFVAVPVSAAFSADDISVSVNVYNITVTATSENEGTMTARLTDNSGNFLYGMKSDRTPVKTTVNGSKKYKYEFSFRMRADVPTATYKITVGNNVAKTEKPFPYVRLGDKIDFYDKLDTKTAGEIKQYFADNPSTVPVDLTRYNALSPNHEGVLALINAEIEKLDLATGIEITDTDEEKVEKVSAVDQLFVTEFAKMMDVVEIAAVEASGWEALMSKYLGTKFDGYFYDAKNLDTSALSTDDVYDNFMIEAAAVADFTVEAYIMAFDKATLTEIAQTRSWGILKEAFLYYEGKKSITPDMTNISPLVNSEQDADFWKDLKNSENASCADLISNAESIAKTTDPSIPGEDSIGGNSTPIDKPTAGGGSLGGGGGGSSADKTPAESEKPTEPETPVVPAGTFNDVENVEWAKEAIGTLAEKGIINGKGNGKYAPNDKVTREEFVKIIIGAFELTDENAKAEFKDVDSARWSYTFIATANGLGIVTGDGKNFNPTGAMSRQDMAVVIWRTAEKLGITLNGDVIAFSDGEQISDYAKNAVDALTAAGIINGMGDGNFAPKETVTRAQAAKVIYGLMVLCGGGK